MFVKLDDETIFDIESGTTYQYVVGENVKIVISFNSPRENLYCYNKFARDLWNFLCNQVEKLD